MITTLNLTPIGGGAFRLDFASDLPDPTFYVYRDGVRVTATKLTSLTVAAAAGEAPLYEVLDDPATTPGAGYPNYAVLAWYAGPGAAEYLVEEGTVGDYAAQILADTPAMYWRLAETAGTVAADASGNGLTGALSNGPTLNQPGGLARSSDPSYRFSAAGSKVQRAFAVDNNTDEFSVEFLIKWDGSDATGLKCPVFNRYEQDLGGGVFDLRGWNFYVRGDSGLSNRLEVWVGNGIGTGAGGAWTVVAGPNLSANVWYHVVASQKDGVVRLYVNDQPYSGTLPLGTTYATNPSVNFILANIGFAPFAGWLDEVATYAAELPRARVAAHFAAAGGILQPLPNVWTERTRVPDGPARPPAPKITVVQAGGTALDGTYTLDYAPSTAGRHRWYWTDGTKSAELKPDLSEWLLLLGDGSHFITYGSNAQLPEIPPSGAMGPTTQTPWVIRLSNTGTPTGTLTLDPAAAGLFFGKRYFTWLSRILDDQAVHQFRVTPVGSNGNTGVAKSFAVLMVRIPDPPSVSYSYDAGTGAVTIAAA